MESMVTQTDHLFQALQVQELAVTKQLFITDDGETIGPEPRSGHRSVCDDANLYSFGGYLKTDLVDNEHRLFEELWCLNFAELSWKLLPTTGTMPQELASHCAVLYGNYLHVFGGTGVSFGESTSNKLTRCDLRTLVWEEVDTTGEPPDPQYGQALVLDEKKKYLYVIGGTTGFEFTMDIHRLNLVTKEWDLVYACKGDQPSEPQARYRHEVAFDGSNIYVFGGGTSLSAFPLKVVPTFNVETRTWTMLKTKRSDVGRRLASASGEFPDIPGYPARRKCHTAVQVQDDVYICGGCSGTRVFDDIWRFHIPTLQWYFIPTRLPIPLSFHTACVTPAGCMYIFGGVTNIERSLRTNKVFKMWLKVPKLKEMAWDALTTTNDNIKRNKNQHLLEVGIPRDFVSRVHPAPPGGKPSETVEEAWESDFLKSASPGSSGGGSSSSQGCIGSFV